MFVDATSSSRSKRWGNKLRLEKIIDVIDKLCSALDCQVGDIFKHMKESDEE